MYAAGIPRRMHPDKSHIFLLVSVLAVLNTLAISVFRSLAGESLLAAATNGFGVSWVIWLAFGSMLHLSLRAVDSRCSRTDLMIAGLCMLLVIVPVADLSAVAATLLAVGTYLSAGADGRLKAAALILGGISVNFLWAPLASHAFAIPLGIVDATLVGWVTGLATHGNTIPFASGAGYVIVSASCTFVQGSSMALLLWLAVTRWVRPVPESLRSELTIFAGIFLSVVVINTARIAIVVQSPAYHDLLHNDIGTLWLNTIILAVSVAWTLFGIRRELLA